MAESGTKITLDAAAIKADRERRLSVGIDSDAHIAKGRSAYHKKGVLTDEERVAANAPNVGENAAVKARREQEVWSAEWDAGNDFDKQFEYAPGLSEPGAVATIDGKQIEKGTDEYYTLRNAAKAEAAAKVKKKHEKEFLDQATVLKEEAAAVDKKALKAAEEARQWAKSRLADAMSEVSNKDTLSTQELQSKLDDLRKNREVKLAKIKMKLQETAGKKGEDTPADLDEQAEAMLASEEEALTAIISNRKRVVFREQSYLVSIMDQLSRTQTDYQELISLNSADSAGITSLLYKFNGLDLLNNLTPAQVALMVPYITITLLEYPTKHHMINGTPIAHPVPLQGLWLREDVFASDPGARGRNLGLKRFNWNPAGGNPFTAMSPLNAELVLYGDSLDVFNEAPYGQLLMPGAGTGMSQMEVKIVVGWSVPENSDVIPANLVAAVNNARTTLFCTNTGQKFDFKDDGSFDLSLTYKARVSFALSAIDLLDVRSEQVRKEESNKAAFRNAFDKFNKMVAKSTTDSKFAVPLMPDELVRLHGVRTGKSWDKYEAAGAKTEAQLQQELTAAAAKDVRDSFSGTKRRGTSFASRAKADLARHRDFVTYTKERSNWEKSVQDAATNRAAATWSSLGYGKMQVDNFINEFTDDPVRRLSIKAMFKREMENNKNPLAFETDSNGNTKLNHDQFKGIGLDVIKDQTAKRTSDRYQQFVNILESFYSKKESERSNGAIYNLIVKSEEIDRYFEQYGGRLTSGTAAGDLAAAATSKLPKEQQDILKKGKTKSTGKGPKPTPKVRKPPKPEETRTMTSLTKGVKGLIKLEDVGEGKRAIPFFYFGDLMDAILRMIKPRAEEENLRVILGSMRFFNQFTKKASLIPLGRIPISVRRYNAWIHDTFVKTIKKITLGEFLTKAVNSLIAPAFSKAAFSNLPTLGKDSPNACTFSFVSGRYASKFFLKPGELSADSIAGVLHNAGGALAEGAINYVLVTSNLEGNYHRRVGDAVSDASRGIPHVYLGANTGMVKNATFSKISLPGYREDRITKGAQSGLGAVREPYNVDLSTLGNTAFKPGVQFFILPTLPGSRAVQTASDVGLGGYYLTLSTDNVITPGKFETIVKGQFEAFATNNIDRTRPANSSPPGSQVRNLSQDTPDQKQGRKLMSIDDSAREPITGNPIMSNADGGKTMSAPALSKRGDDSLMSTPDTAKNGG